MIMTNPTSAGGGERSHELLVPPPPLPPLRPRPLIHHCPLTDPRNIEFAATACRCHRHRRTQKINDQSQPAPDSLTAQLARGNLLFLVYWQIFANILPESLLSNLVWSVAVWHVTLLLDAADT